MLAPDHENINRLLGFYDVNIETPFYAFVSQWRMEGTIKNFMLRNPQTDCSHWVSESFIFEIWDMILKQILLRFME